MQRDCIHRTLDHLNDDPGQVREKIIKTLRTRSTTRPFHVTRSATEPVYPYPAVHYNPYADNYPTGIAISKERFAALPLQRHATRGAWNYTLHPTAGAEPAPVGEADGPTNAARPCSVGWPTRG
jgi:hypothetical protein